MRRSLPLLLVITTLTGCSQVPRDAYIKDLKVGATPWSPTVSAAAIATGSAARNLTSEEKKDLLTPSARK